MSWKRKEFDAKKQTRKEFIERKKISGKHHPKKVKYVVVKDTDWLSNIELAKI